MMLLRILLSGIRMMFVPLTWLIPEAVRCTLADVWNDNTSIVPPPPPRRIPPTSQTGYIFPVELGPGEFVTTPDAIQLDAAEIQTGIIQTADRIELRTASGTQHVFEAGPTLSYTGHLDSGNWGTQ